MDRRRGTGSRPEKSCIPTKRSFLASRIAESSRKKPKLSNPGTSRFCGHCNQRLSLKTYRKHEQLYKMSDQSWMGRDSSDQMFDAETAG